MIDGLDQSARSVLRLEISWLTRKRVGRRRGRSCKHPNPESAGLASSPFRPPLSLASVQIWEATAERLPDLLLDLVCVTRTVDQHNAFRLTSSKLAIRFANALVKLLRLLLHPVWPAWFLHSRLRGGRIDIENKSNVWDAIADSKCIQAF